LTSKKFFKNFVVFFDGFGRGTVVFVWIEDALLLQLLSNARFQSFRIPDVERLDQLALVARGFRRFQT
jgi:hypothetical protein